MTSMINVKQSKGMWARCRHWQDEGLIISKQTIQICQTLRL